MRWIVGSRTHENTRSLVTRVSLTLNDFSPIAFRGRLAAERGLAILLSAARRLATALTSSIGVCAKKKIRQVRQSLGVAFLSFRIIVEDTIYFFCFSVSRQDDDPEDFRLWILYF